MNDTQLFATAVVVLFALLLAPFIRARITARKTIARRQQIKYANQRRDADIALFERFMKTIPYEKGVDYFRDEYVGGLIKNEKVKSIEAFTVMFEDPEFFFFDRQVQKSFGKLIEALYDYDSVQMGYFMNPELIDNTKGTGKTDRVALLGLFFGLVIAKKSNSAYTKDRLKAAADNVEEKYRDFVAVAEMRLGVR
jgi:hypothetical protein